MELRGGDEALAAALVSLDGGGSWTSHRVSDRLQLRSLGEGRHSLLVRGQDQAGNVSPLPCANFSWAVDTVAPVRSGARACLSPA